MRMDIPGGVRGVLAALARAGHEAYCVGGCVRDCLMGRQPSDYDVATSATPEQVKALFARVVPTGEKHGTITVLAPEPVEVTTFRVDGEYRDNRRPERVTFTRSLEEDLSRRDFTVNAMAYSDATGLRDPFGGERDLQARVIACVGAPEKRFDEDGLRVLRALRFAATLDFTIAGDTARAARDKAGLIAGLSRERVYAELGKLLLGDGAARVLRAFPGVLAAAIPQIAPMVGLDQRNPYHLYDVYEHSARAVGFAARDKVTRLAALLHDIGKPACCTLGEDGIGHFYGHAKAGEPLAREALLSLKAEAQVTRDVCELVLYHDRNIPADAKHIRRWLARVGETQTRRLFSLMRADCLAQSPKGAAYAAHMDALDALLEDELAKGGAPSLKTLAVDGRDLMALGMRPGKALGDALAALLSLVVDGDCANEKAALLERARRMMT